MAQNQYEVDNIESLIHGIQALAEGGSLTSSKGVTITREKGRYRFTAPSQQQLSEFTAFLDHQFGAAIGYLGTVASSPDKRSRTETALATRNSSVLFEEYESEEDTKKKRSLYGASATQTIQQQNNEWVASAGDITPICHFFEARQAAKDAGVWTENDQFTPASFNQDANQAIATKTILPEEANKTINVMTDSERQVSALRGQMDKAMPVLATTPLPNAFKNAIGVLHTALTLTDMVNQFNISQRQEQSDFAVAHLTSHALVERGDGTFALDVSSLTKGDRKRLSAGLKTLTDEKFKLSGDEIIFNGKPNFKSAPKSTVTHPFEQPTGTQFSAGGDAALISGAAQQLQQNISPQDTTLLQQARAETNAVLVDKPQPKPIPPQTLWVEKRGSGDQFSERCDHIAKAIQQEAAGCKVTFVQNSAHNLGQRDITFTPQSDYARENFSQMLTVKGVSIPKPVAEMFALREPGGAFRQDAYGHLVFPKGLIFLAAADKGVTVRLPTQQFLEFHTASVERYNAVQPDRSKHIDTSSLLGGIGGFLRDTNRILDRNTDKNGREGVHKNSYPLEVEFLNERPLTQAARFDRLSRIQGGETDIKPVVAAKFSNFLPSAGRVMHRVHEDLAPAIAGYKASYTAHLGSITLNFKPDSNFARYEGSEANHPIRTAMEDLGFDFGKGGCKLHLKYNRDGEVTDVKVVAPYRQVTSVDASQNEVNRNFLGRIGNFVGDTLMAAPVAIGIGTAGAVAISASPFAAGAAGILASASGTAGVLTSAAATALGGTAVGGALASAGAGLSAAAGTALSSSAAVGAVGAVSSASAAAVAAVPTLGAVGTALGTPLGAAGISLATGGVLSRFVTNHKHVASLHDQATIHDVVALREQAVLAEKILAKASEGKNSPDYAHVSTALTRAADRLEAAIHQGTAVSLSEFKKDFHREMGGVRKNAFQKQNILDFGAGLARAAIHAGGADSQFAQHQKGYIERHPSIINPVELNHMHGAIKGAFEDARRSAPSADASFLSSASQEANRAAGASLLATVTQAAAQATAQLYGAGQGN